MLEKELDPSQAHPLAQPAIPTAAVAGLPQQQREPIRGAPIPLKKSQVEAELPHFEGVK